MNSEHDDLGTESKRDEVTMAGAILDAIVDPVLVFNTNDQVESSNYAARTLFGYSQDELIGLTASDLFLGPGKTSPDDSAHALSTLQEQGENGSLLKARNVDGSGLLIHLFLAEICYEQRRSIVATIHDLTSQHGQEVDPIADIQSLESRRAGGESQVERVVDLFEKLAEEKSKLKLQTQQLREKEEELERHVNDLEMTRFQMEKQASAMVELAEDLHSEKKIVEESRRLIEHQAYHDSLTDLGNRALLGKTLPAMFEQANAEGTKVGLIYLDLDNFKRVNDRLGHEVGDRLLCTAADALRACIREEDEVVRQGGDEFAVAVRLGATRTEDDLWELAERIRDALAITIPGPDFTIETGASLGVALYPEDGSDIDAMLVAADAAMYRAKRAGKGRISQQRKPDDP